MRQKIYSFSCLVATALAATVPGNLSAGQQPGGGQSMLRVGVAPTMPPMIFKEAGKVAGVEADLAQAVGRELGRSITFVELPWEDLLDSLETGKIDIVMSS